MKTFIAITSYKKASYAKNVTQKIYRIKRNIPIYLGENHFNTGSMTGLDHEAFGWLVRNKYLPKTYAQGGRKSTTLYMDHNKHNKLFKLIIL